MTQILEKEISSVYNNLTDEMNDDIGIIPSLSQTEAHNYCSQVIEELEKSKSLRTK